MWSKFLLIGSLLGRKTVGSLVVSLNFAQIIIK